MVWLISSGVHLQAVRSEKQANADKIFIEGNYRNY